MIMVGYLCTAEDRYVEISKPGNARGVKSDELLVQCICGWNFCE